MNQFFSFNRFRLLVSKHWADNKKRYALSVLAFISLLIAWFIFSLLVEHNNPLSKEAQLFTYLFAVYLAGSFYASQYFSDLGSKPKGTNFLLVPASVFEKLLCGLLFTVILFFIVFTAAFYLVDILMVSITNIIYKPGELGQRPEVFNIFRSSNVFFNPGAAINFLLVFFSVQSVFPLGSVYFSRFSFLKTVISGFAGFFILFCLIYFFHEKLLPDGEFTRGFLTSYLVSQDGTTGQLVQLPAWIGRMLLFIVMYAVAPFMWLVTYYRLKEKQV